jgi:hypothetical protein
MRKATRYDLLSDFSKPTPGYISMSPSWCVAVFGESVPVTFSRNVYDSLDSGSGGIMAGVQLRPGHPLILTDEVVQMQISNTKRNHIKQMSLSLKSGINFLNASVMAPGDYIMAWCWNNEEASAPIIDRIKGLKPANYWSDGLKFVGKVHNVRKSIRVNPDGIKDVDYSVTCLGFEELETQFFYDLNLASSSFQTNIQKFMASVGLEWTKVFGEAAAVAGRIQDNSGLIIEAIIDVIIGKGIGSIVQDTIDVPVPEFNGARPRVAPQANKEAPYAYLVPKAVASVLGRETKESKVASYAEILDSLIGVQKYGNPDGNLPTAFSPSNSNYGREFTPGNISDDHDNYSRVRIRTKEPIKGSFVPVEPSFVNKPLIQILHQYINPAINEIYCALKVNSTGSVVPTIVARQIPFSTNVIEQDPLFPLTRFMELPRWVVDPTMVSSLDIGRSNATRINMVHVYGSAPTSGVNDSTTHQMVRYPPIYDTADISRSGIKAMMRTVDCNIIDSKRTDAKSWMRAIADWTMGSHLTLNGTIEMTGVQSPIVEGDNLEFEGVVYHIEGVNHTCSIDDSGNKTFKTSVSLSNGMPIAPDDQVGDDFPTYPGLQNSRKNKPVAPKADEASIFPDQDNSSNDPDYRRKHYEQDIDTSLTNPDQIDPPTLSNPENSERTTTASGNDDFAVSVDPGHTTEYKKGH